MGVRQVVSTLDLVMGSLMAIALTVYLVYAMLRPEKF
jgi:K+-transporting ATPase KdpF subunit